LASAIGLDRALHPARRDHQRQVVDQVAHHLVGRGTGADDDAGAQLGDRHRAPAQRLAGLHARDQVLGVGVLRHQAAEVDDAADAGRGGGAGEVLRRHEVEPAEVAAGGHRMHQVVGDVDAGERGGERLRLQRVAADQVDRTPHGIVAARLQHLEAARRGAHAPALAEQPRHQVRADVAAGAEDQGAGRSGGRRNRRQGRGEGHRRRCGRAAVWQRRRAPQPQRRAHDRRQCGPFRPAPGPMPRIVINGEEIRSPLARLVLLVAVSVVAAVVLASAAAWVLILLGLGTALALVAFALALLVAAVVVPWAIVSALLGRGRRR
jgi:hypothetical protein